MGSATGIEPANSSRPASQKPWLLASGLAVAVIAAIELALHLYTNTQYGYFRDELYYLDCARHLAWGYVDQPPLIAAVAWLERILLSDSLYTIRILPALSAAAKVILTGLLAREL